MFAQLMVFCELLTFANGMIQMLIQYNISPLPTVYMPGDAFPSPGVNPLEGPPKCSCEKRDSEGRSQLPAL